MATAKKLTDLIDYTSVLPYASEIFGIYQPLIGWKSQNITRRFQRGFHNDKRTLLNRLLWQFTGQVDVRYDVDCQVRIDLKAGALEAGRSKSFDSIVLKQIAAQLPPYDQYAPGVWPNVISQQQISTILETIVPPEYSRRYSEHCRGEGANRATPHALRRRAVRHSERDPFLNVFESNLQFESSVAGALLFLTERKEFNVLFNIFYGVTNNSPQALELVKVSSAMQFLDGYLNLDTMDPQDQDHLKRVALSPISVVHLFRQYFFELDSFLGPPVSHVWLSPGSTVELIEIHTRKTIVEKALETAIETITKTELETTEQDEISDAVKQDNKQDIKVGASVSASYLSVTATSSLDFNASQQTAREETHKRMRQQTEKLSTEIRKNFKSTFKTITETTDTSSKRYILTNTTDKLINYELRRKMRQVAVQVQDIGTYLCWQTYVDRPGESLGVAQLMHIAKPADLDALHKDDEILALLPFDEPKVFTVNFVSTLNDANNEDEVYKDGVEVDNTEAGAQLEKIQADHQRSVQCKHANYVLSNVTFDAQSKPVSVSLKEDTNGDVITNEGGGKASFVLHLDSVDFQGKNSVEVQATLQWIPTDDANKAIEKENDKILKEFKAKEAQAYQKAFLEAANERIKLMHEIGPRPSDELREEERIVVYRKLIQDMLTYGITKPDDRTQHVVAELINSIFDVDKMLYFVGHEWWRPRISVYGQAGINTRHDNLASSTVSWGGPGEVNRDNYYITGDSEPAKFGSSLGWLLQLDGDNMRNAFLNAPWVKAVMPIRPGKERAAVNWLKGVEGFNGIGENDIYQSNNPNEKDSNGNALSGQKMIDVIMDLAKKIQQKHQAGVAMGKYPKQDEVADPALVDEENVVTSTPIDRVYEHGFYPLPGGFRANVTDNYQVFDQWLEVLPTDQVVPVEVTYDAKTGRQL